MIDSKASRFGKKAMCLFLSSAMVVAFAPAVGAVVANDATCAFAASDLTPAANFSNGKVTGLTVDGAAVTITYNDNVQESVSVATNKITKQNADGSYGWNFAITQVTPFAEDTAAVDTSDTDLFETTVKLGETAVSIKEDGTLIDGSGNAVSPSVGSTLTVTLTAKSTVTAEGKTASEYAGGSITLTLTLVNAALTGVTGYSSENTDGSFKQEWTYNATAQTINFALGTTKLTAGTDYTVQYVKQSADGTYNVNAPISGAPKDAGAYRAYLTGMGTYDGSNATFDLEVSVLDLANENVAITIDKSSDSSKLEITSATVSGTSIAGALEIKSITAAKSQGDEVNYAATDNAWTVVVGPTDVETNITGTYTCTFSNAVDKSETLQYNSGALPTTTIAQAEASPVDLSAAEPATIDLSKITTTDTTLTNALVTTVQAVDENGNTTGDALTGDAAQAALKTAGLWKVTATIDSAAANYAAKGEKSFYTKVINGTVESVVLTVGSTQLTTGTTATLTYTGEAFAVSAKGLSSTGATIGASDALAVSITKDGQVATEIKDAGSYVITLSGGSYVLSAPMTYTLTVSSLATKTATLDGVSDGGDVSMQYSGSAYDVVGKLKLFGTDDKELTVPSGQYAITITQTKDASGEALAQPQLVEQAVERGTYTIAIADNAQAADTGNYAVGSYSFTLTIGAVKVGYAELDKSVLPINSDGAITYSGTAIAPAVTFFTADTSAGGTQLDVPTDNYSLTLKKATSFEYSNNMTYQTVDSNMIEGAGYYLLVIGQGTSGDYDMSALGAYASIPFQVVEAQQPADDEPADDEPEKVAQDVQITTSSLKIKRGSAKKVKVSGVKTSYTLSKVSGSEYLKISGKKIKVKSGAKKGKTYKIKVKVKAAASDAYEAATVTKTIKVTVKK